MKNVPEKRRGRTNTLSKQLSRLITWCCVVAITIQSCVMVGMIINQYIQQEIEDTLYILESDNEKMEVKVQYMEELVLTIKHNLGLRSFFHGELYSNETTTQQLENSASVFSERNRMENSQPFIEKIYLFNLKGDSICQLYYPITVAEYDAFREKYEKMYQEFLNQEKDFYFLVEEDHINLCMYLYDDNMKNMGGCIFALNKSGIESNYHNMEEMGRFFWSMRNQEQILLEKSNLLPQEKDRLIENSFSTGFGITFFAGISEFVILSSLWTTVAITVLTAGVLIFVLSFLAHLLSLHYVRPLETIAEKIKQVGKGNFDTKLDEYQVEELKNISETFNDMTDYINKLIREVYETQLIAKQSQIQYLQAQMNPHFLFNVLSMISMKAAINGDKEVHQLIYKLSKLYQGKVFRRNEPVIPLMEEMEIADFYLSIQNSRFGDKITYSIEYEGKKEDYEGLMVPRLSIEPIVENAVCHGLEPKEGNGHIHIKIGRDEQILKIIITDDGIGFDANGIKEQKADKNHTHVGIWNTNKMINNLYGEKYGLEINSIPAKGTRVTVTLPIRKEDGYVEGYDC